MQSQLVAGDTLNYEIPVLLYPANAGWTLKFRLVPRSGASSPIQLQATTASDGASYLVQVVASQTASWAPGHYSYAAWVENNAGEKYTVETGQIEVLPDPRSASSGTDTRSLAERALEDARAALAAWTPTTKSYTIGGRQMQFNSTADIILVIERWQIEVKREREAARLSAGMKSRRKIMVRLG